jgi:hypothetical protein
LEFGGAQETALGIGGCNCFSQRGFHGSDISLRFYKDKVEKVTND